MYLVWRDGNSDAEIERAFADQGGVLFTVEEFTPVAAGLAALVAISWEPDDD